MQKPLACFVRVPGIRNKGYSANQVGGCGKEEGFHVSSSEAFHYTSFVSMTRSLIEKLKTYGTDAGKKFVIEPADVVPYTVPRRSQTL